jgi:hypothetical protein
MHSLSLIRLSCLIAGVTLLISSCTKTVTNDPPAVSKSRILGFKIANSATPISGIVDGSDNTITVYLPPASYLTILEPQITLSEGATVTPASGTFIEDLAGYFAKGRTLQYTVTGADKSVTTYTLKLISQQPALAFEEISTDAANPVTFNQMLSSVSNNLVLYTKTPYLFSLSATVSEAVGRVWLVAADNKEYPMVTGAAYAPSFASAQTSPASYANISLGGVQGFNPQNPGANKNAPPAGLYRIKVQYYSRITTLNNPIRIVYE